MVSTMAMGLARGRLAAAAPGLARGRLSRRDVVLAIAALAAGVREMYDFSEGLLLMA